VLPRDGHDETESSSTELEQPDKENAPSPVLPNDRWNNPRHSEGVWSGLAVGFWPDDAQTLSFVGAGQGHPNGQGIPDMEGNDKSEMDADFSVPMVEDMEEDEDELKSPSLVLWSTTTFHPPAVCPPPPYAYRDGVGDIVLEDYVPACTGDSAMADAELESRDVAGTVPTTQMGQTPPPAVSSNVSVSFPGALPWPSVGTAAFVETQQQVPTVAFGPPLLGDIHIHAPNSMVPPRLPLPLDVYVQGHASLYLLDQPQRSTPMAEVERSNDREVVTLTVSPFPVPAAPVGYAARCSSLSPSSPSPPSAVTNEASPVTHTTIGKLKRALEDLEDEMDSDPASPAGIPRKMMPLRCVLIRRVYMGWLT
jgi:hypothetical protein